MKARINESAPNITILGGGGGASTVAAGMVEQFPDANISAVICTSDDGGSTGRLRKQFETMPVGDIRRVIARVAISADITRSLEHRFGKEAGMEDLQLIANSLDDALRNATSGYDPRQVHTMLNKATEIGKRIEGGLGGHTYGNLLLTGMATEYDFSDAVRMTSEMVEARANVIPVTTTPHVLKMYDGREIIEGEHNIDEWPVFDSSSAYVWLEPTDGTNSTVEADPEAVSAIEQADLILVSPGSPFTSIAPVLVAGGVDRALQKQESRGGTLIGITNLENNDHDTADWCVGRHAQFYQRYIGKRTLDAMVYNDVPHELPNPQNAVPYNPFLVESLDLKAVPLPLVGSRAVVNPNDPIKRSDAYHDIVPIAQLVRGNYHFGYPS